MGFGDVPPPGVVLFGPEVCFGDFMGDFYEEPVLLIKFAFGGFSSLAVDLRPASSGFEGGYWNVLNVTLI